MKLTRTKAAALALLALIMSPAAASEYLALRFPPAERPSVYLKLYKTTLQVAASAAGLDDAPRVEPLPEATETYAANPEGGGKLVNYGYPKVPLPTAVAGFKELSISPRLYRHLPGSASQGQRQRTVAIVLPVTFTKEDAGIAWGYVIEGFASEDISTRAESPTVIAIEPPRGLKLTVQAKLDEETKKVGLGVALLCGRSAIQTATKGERPALARLAVYDSAGALVHSQDGDLEKFGFT